MTTKTINDSYTNIRLINEKEKTIIRDILKKHGYGDEVSGSFVQQANGKICYHLCILDTKCSATFGSQLGIKISNSLGADEVFCMGIKM